MTDKKKIVERIQKLLAMADTRNYNQHEAASAAKQAQILLNRYNLTITEVEAKEVIYIDQMAKESEEDWQDWQLYLMRGIENAFGVKVLLMSTLNNKGDVIQRFYRHVGGGVDIETSRYTFEFLTQIIERLCGEVCEEAVARERVKKDLTPSEKTLWDSATHATASFSSIFDMKPQGVDKASYRLGLVASICQKLEDMKPKEEKYGMESSAGKNKIIHIKKDALAKYIANADIQGEVRKGSSVKDNQAFNQGRQDGLGVEIRKGIN